MRKMVVFGENELDDDFEDDVVFKFDVCCCFDCLLMFVSKCISDEVEFGVKGIKIEILGLKNWSSRKGTTKTGQLVLVQLVRGVGAL